GEDDNTGNGALSSRVMVPVEHSLPADRRFTVIHQGRRQMLDHIMVSRRLMGRYRGSEIHNEALADELTGQVAVNPSPVSYHAPVVALFDLPTGGGG
ncbi:MAG: endonuclease, partial [Alphaproteobacteria bacterium]